MHSHFSEKNCFLFKDFRILMKCKIHAFSFHIYTCVKTSELMHRFSIVRGVSASWSYSKFRRLAFDGVHRLNASSAHYAFRPLKQCRVNSALATCATLSTIQSHSKFSFQLILTVMVIEPSRGTVPDKTPAVNIVLVLKVSRSRYHIC